MRYKLLCVVLIHVLLTVNCEDDPKSQESALLTPEDATSDLKPSESEEGVTEHSVQPVEDNRPDNDSAESTLNSDTTPDGYEETTTEDPWDVFKIFDDGTQEEETEDDNSEPEQVEEVVNQIDSVEPVHEVEVVQVVDVRPTTQENALDDRVSKLSDQIRSVLQNYQTHGKVTVPGANIPDPMKVPDIKKTIGNAPIVFKDMHVYGLSNFTIDHVNTDLAKMQVFISLSIKRLVILGNYSIKSWFSKAAGPFNVTLLDVEASGAAELKRDEDGNLLASDSEMDMTFMDTRVDFKNLGMMGGLLQGIIAGAGPLLFEAVKPTILAEVNTRMRSDVNEKIKAVGDKFANHSSAPPLDLAVAEGRKYVKNSGYDPYLVKDYFIETKVFTLNISHFWLAGLSRFYRVGDVGLSMDSGTVQMSVHIATKELIGQCLWNVTVAKQYERVGTLNFTIDHLQIKSIVNQSLDVKQHPVLEDLDINVGKLKLRLDRKGKFDFLIEGIANSLPDILRHVVVDALEGPIKLRVQQLLNDVDVQEILEKGLPELDKAGL